MVFGFLHYWVVVGYWVITHGPMGFLCRRAVTHALVALFAFLLVAGSANAAQNGRLGTTSTGSITISLVKPPMIQVRGASESVLVQTSVRLATGVVSKCVNAQLFGGRYSVIGTSVQQADVRLAVKRAAVYRDHRACPGGRVHRYAVRMHKAGAQAAAGVVSLTFRPE